MVCVVPPAAAVGSESTVKTPVLMLVLSSFTEIINPVEALALRQLFRGHYRQ
jgi:hypothetical protein